MGQQLAPLEKWDNPKSWKERGYDDPNSTAKVTIACIVYSLGEIYGLVPVYILPIADGGMCVEYSDDRHHMTIEAYNDGDVGGIVNDDIAKEMIFNQDIECFDFRVLVGVFLALIKRSEG